MGGIVILIIILVVVSGSCFIIGSRTAKNPDSYLRRHPAFAKSILLAYVVFAGCFVFPIRSTHFPLDLTKLYVLAASYGMIGLGFAGLYGESKEKFVFPATLFLTMAGMACRYALEYGEVSNTYNFTVPNIVSYLVIIPVLTLTAYCWIVKFLTQKK